MWLVISDVVFCCSRSMFTASVSKVLIISLRVVMCHSFSVVVFGRSRSMFTASISTPISLFLISMGWQTLRSWEGWWYLRELVLVSAPTLGLINQDGEECGGFGLRSESQ